MIGQMSLFPATGKLKNRVELIEVELSDVRQVLEERHYLKRARTGRQINYAIIIDGKVDGVITYAYPMMSADLCGCKSDEILEFARLFLASNIPHSASCAIGKSLRRIQRDWSKKFPDAKPVRMIVSWSDTTRHIGTIYKASNFVWLRRSDGKQKGGDNGKHTKRGARVIHADMRHDKDCWIYNFGN